MQVLHNRLGRCNQFNYLLVERNIKSVLISEISHALQCTLKLKDLTGIEHIAIAW